ncbi:unnamed protein product [Menidia menidia]|uniref:(Atlantic silverside) hypothetical protein n=1 Tax=Menidia menidia TaxID=238744 RepID=A0A8S4AFN7_9TELE|nr:unnamed protein product [Menidia menidia]
MKILLLLSASLMGALAVPLLPPDLHQNPTVSEGNRGPLLGDVVPVMGHVVVENPAPQVMVSPKEQGDRKAPVDKKQSQTVVRQEVKAEVDVRAEQEVKRPDAKVQEQLKEELEAKPEAEAEVVAENKIKQETLADPELQPEQDFKVESEVKVEPDVQMMEEEDPETEADSDLLVEERHIDMERKYEAIGEAEMELEPLEEDMYRDEDSHTESESAPFQGQEAVLELLPEEQEEEDVEEDREIQRMRSQISAEDSILTLEPEMGEDPLPNELNDESLEEGQDWDTAGQQSLSENSFPDEEGVIEMSPEYRNEYSMMEEEAQRIRDEEPPAQFFEEQEMEEEAPQTDGMSKSEASALVEDEPDSLERRHCSGLLFEGKCYQFFREPKDAEASELFCQESFPGGHLASITSAELHREVMKLILKENGHRTRTWVGGLRNLKTNGFIWIDGSRWGYADWLSGEPNNTSRVENCLEVLGSGKFNDFTCWEPQTFLCSFSYQ